MSGNARITTIIVDDEAFNMHNAHVWAEQFEIKSASYAHIIVDLTQIQVIDSAAIGQLFRLQRVCETGGGRVVVLVGENRKVGTILKQSHIPLALAHDESEAMALLNSQ